MKCEDARAAISARLDGEPLGIDPCALDAHLAVCADCRSEAGSADMVGGLLRSVEPPRASAGFNTRVIGSGTRRSWFDRLCDWFESPPRRVAAAVAVSAAVVCLTLSSASDHAPSRADQLVQMRTMAQQSGMDPDDIQLLFPPDKRRTEGGCRRCI